MNIPTDTVLDQPEHQAKVDAEALDVMKAIYLAKAEGLGMRKALGMTDTEIINSMENLRTCGYIRVVWVEGKGARIDLMDGKGNRRGSV